MLPLLKRKARLLVLDDDLSMQKLMGTLLRRAGHRVDTVTAGAQAIEKLGRHQYDGLLLDLMTPTEGGMTVIRHLQENAPEMLKRVVLVTASPESVLKMASRGVFGVVRKPFDAGELISTIERLLQQ
ncbi:MAG TPA: response regulator [Thermoanaerobaculia bacterium]|jgi:two-component system response regulator GlrR|nr:response regulator [Thermoanaerobaculia bacterium]